MCGGIVGAFSLGSASRLSLLLSYNFGRIASYGFAGALAGALGGGLDAASSALTGQLPLRIGLALAANLMLILLGIYLMGATRSLLWVEGLGSGLWRRLQPLTRSFLPARTPGQAFPLGLLWGWLPCGLVYSALISALTTGSAWRGAGMMLAFGLGTLPVLLAAGALATQLKSLLARPMVRRLAGLAVLLIGFQGGLKALGMLM